jgi:hypothetical protein
MRRIVLALGVVVIAVAVTAMAQTPASPQVPATPKFDLASVKPCAPGDGAGRAVPGQRGGPGGGGTVITSPGRLVVNCMSVSTMINIYHWVANSKLRGFSQF